MSQIKAGDIITMIKYDTPPGNFWTEEECHKYGVFVGRAYKCIKTLILTAPNFYIPERASQPGVTIEGSRGKWGTNKPCIPTECFRIATPEERREWMWNKPNKSTRGSRMLRRTISKTRKLYGNLEI